MNAIVLQFVGLLALGTSVAVAQPFTITGQVIAGGGGVASGGRFQITGTIGQPEAGPRLTGGCMAITPGFWGARSVVTTPGAPALHVRRLDPNYVRVSFTPGCGDWILQRTFVLEANPDLIPWRDDPASELTLVDGELVRDFHLPSWGPNLYFRLRQQ